MPVFVARNSPWRVLLLLAGALGFVAAGAWIAGLFGAPLVRGGEWIGWIGMIFFGLCAMAAIPRLVDGSNCLEISSLGILSRPWSEETIPWSEIDRVTVWKYERTRSIVLHLRDPARFPSATLLGRLAGANRMLTGGDVAITMTGTDRTTDETLAAIGQWIPGKIQA